MYPHCTVRIRLLYAFNKYFDFDFEVSANLAKTYTDATLQEYEMHIPTQGASCTPSELKDIAQQCLTHFSIATNLQDILYFVCVF